MNHLLNRFLVADFMRAVRDWRAACLRLAEAKIDEEAARKRYDLYQEEADRRQEEADRRQEEADRRQEESAT